MKRKWKRLKPNQYDWYYNIVIIFCICLPVLLLLYAILRKEFLLLSISVFIIGVLFTAIVHFKWGKHMKISKQMEQFVRRNGLSQSHYVKEQGIWGERKIERIDYYPIIEYKKIAQDNIFCIRIRMDGCLRSEKFRDLEQPLADMFCTVCTDKIEERGYLIYCFELQEQEQVKIQSNDDILPVSETEIAFSRDIVWNWKRCPHLMITGTTGSGKTQLTQYIISCLLKQGVRVIYCDPKKDDDMRLFMRNNLSISYVTNENAIAKIVRETEEEVRARELDLKNINLEEADFNPVFLLFDEMIAFAKIAERKTYEETMTRLSSIVVTGRSKRIYAGIILQRPDTSFIEGAIRDNLSCRICMGKMSETAYKMAFGTDFSDIKNHRHEIGSGLIYRQGIDTKPREFLAPFICKGALNRK